VARAALTAATVMAMATPAMAHPNLKDYVDGHTHEVRLPMFHPIIEAQIETEMAREARREWHHWDRRYDRRMKRLARQREANAVPAVPVSPSTDVVEIIYSVFGAYGSQAVAVATCESSLLTYAVNGEYVNIFQMGYEERQIYGWHVAGSPAIVAARAAFRYFVASGRDWSPWSCKP